MVTICFWRPDTSPHWRPGTRHVQCQAASESQAARASKTCAVSGRQLEPGRQGERDMCSAKPLKGIAEFKGSKALMPHADEPHQGTRISIVYFTRENCFSLAFSCNTNAARRMLDLSHRDILIAKGHSVATSM